jgi:hypothetical protein
MIYGFIFVGLWLTTFTIGFAVKVCQDGVLWSFEDNERIAIENKIWWAHYQRHSAPRYEGPYQEIIEAAARLQKEGRLR